MTLLRRVLRAARLLPLLLKRAVVKGWHDRVLGLSAEAAFWQLLSLPSLFLSLIASLGYVSRWFGAGTVQQTELKIENALSRAFSEQVVQQVIRPTLREVLLRRSRRHHQHRRSCWPCGPARRPPRPSSTRSPSPTTCATCAGR